MKNVILKIIPLLALGLWLLTGCDNQPTEVEDYVAQPVVSAFLFNGEPLNEIFLEWVAPLTSFYNRNEQGIDSAEVLIIRLADNATQNDTFRLKQKQPTGQDSSWVYIPDGDTLTPQSFDHYRLEVSKPSEGINLWAETTVPDTFSLWNLPNSIFDDTLETMNREEPNLFLTWNGSPADSTGGYVLVTVAQTPVDSLIPLDPDFIIGEDELEPEGIDLASFFELRFDEVQMVVPWIMFNWVGWTKVELQSVSPEYNDYILSLIRSLMQGFPIDFDSNVHGGLGVFGGLTRQTFYVYMERVE